MCHFERNVYEEAGREIVDGIASGVERVYRELSTPPDVVRAIDTIRAYLQVCGYKQAIISCNGGASFGLMDIFDLLFEGDDDEQSDQPADR